MTVCKYLVAAFVAGASFGPGVRAQPPDEVPRGTAAEQQEQEQEQWRKEHEKWKAERLKREALARRTPSGVLWQFVAAIETNDLVLAAFNVEGYRDPTSLVRVQALRAKTPGEARFSITPLFGEAPAEAGEGAEIEARVAVSLRQSGLWSDEALLLQKATSVERLTMRRSEQGDWKIVPKKPLALPAPPQDQSVEAQTRAVEASVRTAQSEEDGLLNIWARALVAPREMLVASTARSSVQNVKQVLLGALQLTQDYDEKFAFTAANFREKVMPYVKNEALFLAPALDEEKAFAYAINPTLPGKSIAQIDEAAQTVAIYEATADGKVLYRFDGKAVVGFVDGHVALVGPEQAEKMVWAIEPRVGLAN